MYMCIYVCVSIYIYIYMYVYIYIYIKDRETEHLHFSLYMAQDTHLYKSQSIYHSKGVVFETVCLNQVHKNKDTVSNMIAAPVT
jgi:hypothetical protein